MQFNQDEFLSQLYFDSLKQRTEIKILRGLLLNLISQITGPNLETLKKTFDAELLKVLEGEILGSPLRDEYLQGRAEDFLKQMKDQL